MLGEASPLTEPEQEIAPPPQCLCVLFLVLDYTYLYWLCDMDVRGMNNYCMR